MRPQLVTQEDVPEHKLFTAQPGQSIINKEKKLFSPLYCEAWREEGPGCDYLLCYPHEATRSQLWNE